MRGDTVRGHWYHASGCAGQCICCAVRMSKDITWLPEQCLRCGEPRGGKLDAFCILTIDTWLPEQYEEVLQAAGRGGSAGTVGYKVGTGGSVSGT